MFGSRSSSKPYSLEPSSCGSLPGMGEVGAGKLLEGAGGVVTDSAGTLSKSISPKSSGIASYSSSGIEPVGMAVWHRVSGKKSKRSLSGGDGRSKGTRLMCTMYCGLKRM